jgi:hypothetical protein
MVASPLATAAYLDGESRGARGCGAAVVLRLCTEQLVN